MTADRAFAFAPRRMLQRPNDRASSFPGVERPKFDAGGLQRLMSPPLLTDVIAWPS